MVISVNAKDIKKLIFSIENLFALKMQDRVRPAAIAKLIELFISSDLPENDFLFYRKKIFTMEE